MFFVATGEADADQAQAVANGYRLVWVDPSSSNALWVGPGDRQDQLAAAGDLLSPAGLTAEAIGEATDDDLVVDLDVPFPDVAPGDYTVSVQILREQVARFGEDARAKVTIPA